MRTLYLETPYGDRYYIHDNGNIERTDIPGFRCSDQWRLIGIVRTGPGFAFGTGLIPLCELTPERVRAIEWQHKNGTPRYTARDCDHGTVRTWGNTRVHGIKRIVSVARERDL